MFNIGKLGLVLGGTALAIALLGTAVSIAGPNDPTPTGDGDSGLIVSNLGI